MQIRSEKDDGHDIPDKKGILWNKSPEQAQAEGIDLTSSNLDMHCLFGDLEGAVLLDQIFKFWGDQECDIPWFYTGSNTEKNAPQNALNGGGITQAKMRKLV